MKNNLFYKATLEECDVLVKKSDSMVKIFYDDNNVEPYKKICKESNCLNKAVHIMPYIDFIMLQPNLKGLYKS